MSVASKVASILKSLTGGEEGKEDPDLDKEDPDQEGAGEGGVEGDGEVKKSGDLLDATEVLGELVTELKDMNKSLKALAEKQDTLEKSQVDVGEAVVGVAELVSKIANSPAPLKAAMSKGNLGGAAPGAGAFPRITQPDCAPTKEEFERAQDILVKAVAAGEISLQKSELITSDLQKAMVIPGYKMDPENFNLIARKMSA